jgi:hypothetical protein
MRLWPWTTSRGGLGGRAGYLTIVFDAPSEDAAMKLGASVKFPVK